MIESSQPLSTGSTGASSCSASGRFPPLTLRHYELFPEDGNRHEILGGDHYMTPAPTIWHQEVSGNLGELLRRWVREHRLGKVLYAPVDVQLSDHDIVQPDLVFVSTERKAVLTPKRIVGAPDLVVEILSPATEERDREVKRDTYDRFGVREYWIVDPDACTVIVHARGPGGRLAVARSFAREEVLTSALLPGFTAPLVEVFAREL